tara:strand:- start:40836 stop:41264 length:429 start_codon:yes stop_codon:yes gene_type:complete
MAGTTLPDQTRLAHRIVTGLLLAQIAIPLFFSSQILLVWAGLEQFTISPANVRVAVHETPLPAIIAPMLRVGLIAAMLCTHYWWPKWTLGLLVCSTIVHVIGWLSIFDNLYFNLPTGYITLAVEMVLLALLVLNPRLRGRTG